MAASGSSVRLAQRESNLWGKGTRPRLGDEEGRDTKEKDGFLRPVAVRKMGTAGPGPRIVVIVPTYNEHENTPILLERIFSVATEEHLGLEVLIVDDHSPDGTAEVARREAGKYSGKVKVLEREGPRGLAVAVLDGIRATTAPAIVVMDGDLAHPPEAIPALLEPILSGKAQFVVGSRYVEGSRIENWTLFRWLNSKVASLLARPLTKVKDPMSGFFSFSRDVLEHALSLKPTGYKILLELLVKTACREVIEVPIVFCDRTRGASKMGLGEQARFLVHLGKLYAYRVTSSRKLVHS
jgi:dolichol-phosphate mannosyltransferase